MTETWQRAHDALLRIAKKRAALDREEGRALLVAYRERAHERLGFGSFVEYVERLLGYGPRTTLDKLRVAEALEQLPELDAALQTNQLTWSAVRELTRVATPANRDGMARGGAIANRPRHRAPGQRAAAR